MSIENTFDISLIAALALREKQIQQNYRPIIGVHKRFARRPEVSSAVWYYPNLAMNLSPRLAFAPRLFRPSQLPTPSWGVARR